MILAFFKLYFSPPNSVYLYPADVFMPFCRSSPSSLFALVSLCFLLCNWIWQVQEHLFMLYTSWGMLFWQLIVLQHPWRLLKAHRKLHYLQSFTAGMHKSPTANLSKEYLTAFLGIHLVQTLHREKYFVSSCYFGNFKIHVPSFLLGVWFSFSLGGLRKGM